MTDTAYRVTNWNKHFENNRTREIQNLSWVPVPNKQDGDGYTELMDDENGAAHFGVWVALLQVASRCDPRGTLLRDSRGEVLRGHDASSLSRMVRIPHSLVSAAILRLLSIGWLEVIDLQTKDLTEWPQELAVIPQGDVSSLRLAHGRATEQNRTEQNGTKGSATRKKRVELVEPEIPESLRDRSFVEAWGLWRAHRTEIKHPLTPTATRQQLSALAEMGVHRAVIAIRHSITRGWRSINEPNGAPFAALPLTANGKPSRQPNDTESRRTAERAVSASHLTADERAQAVVAIRKADFADQLPGILEPFGVSL